MLVAELLLLRSSLAAQTHSVTLYMTENFDGPYTFAQDTPFCRVVTVAFAPMYWNPN